MATRTRPAKSVFPPPMTLPECLAIVGQLDADAKGDLVAYLAGRFPLVFDQILRETGRSHLLPERIRSAR